MFQKFIRTLECLILFYEIKTFYIVFLMVVLLKKRVRYTCYRPDLLFLNNEVSSYLSRIVNLHQSVHKMFHNDFRFGQLLNFIHEDSGSGEQEALSRIPNKFISICWMHFFDVNSGNGISIFRPFYCTFFFLKGATSKQIPRRWDDHFI